MTDDTSRVPKLRFPGFAGAWEQRKLGGVTDILTGFPFQSQKFSNVGTPLIRGANVKRGYLDLSVNNTVYWGNVHGLERYFLSENDIVIQMDGALIGKSYACIRKENLPSLLVQRVARLRSKGTFPAFIYQSIQRGFLVYIKRKKTETAVPHLSSFDIHNFRITIPSLSEQQRIGIFFGQLDDLITLHRRKLSHLRQLKKGLLQKMFPKSGEDRPEVRFPGFVDAWEQRKFFESIASTIDFRGRTPKKLGMDWSDSGYLALSALNVKNGYIDPLADAHYGDEKLYRKWMSGRELKKGQVLFTTEAPMGNVAQVPDDNGYILSQRTVAFETKEDMMTNDFLAVLLKSPLVFNNLSALSSGGTAKGVSQKSLKGLSITVPLDIDEQQKIGSFFKQLDKTIALHQRKLSHLQQQKKALLQQMFV